MFSVLVVSLICALLYWPKIFEIGGFKMDLSRRDFLRFSAVSAAMAAAGMADPSDLTAANTQTIPVGQCRYCAIGCTTVADAEVDSAGKVVKIQIGRAHV
jgi:anaerobic selenocysteine-containing dehydrogenase